MSQQEEVRVVDQKTGGAKGSKPEMVGALDALSLLTVGRVAGMGATKYARFNFLKGYNWSLSFDAMMRHALAFWNGEDLDQESKLPHMAHCAWHGLTLVSFLLRGLGTDDRFKGGYVSPDALADVEAFLAKQRQV